MGRRPADHHLVASSTIEEVLGLKFWDVTSNLNAIGQGLRLEERHTAFFKSAFIAFARPLVDARHDNR